VRACTCVCVCVRLGLGLGFVLTVLVSRDQELATGKSKMQGQITCWLGRQWDGEAQPVVLLLHSCVEVCAAIELSFGVVSGVGPGTLVAEPIRQTRQ